jgi:NTE family protein
MTSFIRRFFRSLWKQWPVAWPHRVAAFAAKAVMVGHMAGLLFVLLVVVGVPALAALAFAALWFGGLLLLINALVRWFKDDQPLTQPRPMPVTPNPPLDLEKLLGPFNAQEGLRLYDAVFEGGGVKAIAEIGALARFHELGLRPRKIIATSGGAIVGAFLLAGTTPQDIWRALASTDLTRILDPRWLPNQRWLRRSMCGLLPLLPELVLWKGAVRGRAFERMMREELSRVCAVANLSFRAFRERQQGETYPVELKVIATDVTLRRALALPNDIADYDGWQTESEGWGSSDDLSVARAVRMSMSIPFVFEPVELRERANDVPVDIVDGGISSNYPIRYFDSHQAEGPRFPTFGFLLDERLSHSKAKPSTIRWLGDFASHVIQSGIGAIDRILTDHDEARSICIPTLGVGTIDFDLPPKKQEELFWAGYNAATEKLAQFSWHAYVKEFRGGRASIPDGATGEPGEIDGVVYSRPKPPVPAS